MANDIAFVESFTHILDAAYQRSSVSRCLNSGNRIIQASRHAKEIKIPKVRGDWTRGLHEERRLYDRRDHDDLQGNRLRCSKELP